MKKIKLLGIGKSEHHNYYILPKEQTIFKLLRSLAASLNMEYGSFIDIGLKRDKFGTPTKIEEKIGSWTDKRLSDHDDDCQYYFEVIFEKDKVFLTIHTKQDRQQEIYNLFTKFIKTDK